MCSGRVAVVAVKLNGKIILSRSGIASYRNSIDAQKIVQSVFIADKSTKKGYMMRASACCLIKGNVLRPLSFLLYEMRLE